MHSNAAKHFPFVVQFKTGNCDIISWQQFFCSCSNIDAVNAHNNFFMHYATYNTQWFLNVKHIILPTNKLSLV